MASVKSNAMIPEYNKSCLVIHLLNHRLNYTLNVVHFPLVLGMLNVVGVASMIHSYQVRDQKLEI